MSVRLLCCSGSLEGGGSERQLWQLATRVDQDYFCPHIYLHYRRGLYLDRTPASIPIFDFWTGQEGRRLLPGQIHRAQVTHLANTIQRSSINLVYDRTFHMTLVTAPACRRTNCRRISTIVSPPSKDFAQSKERFAFIKKWLLRRAYLQATSSVIVVSEDVAADSAEFYRLPQSRFTVVPSPVDIQAVCSASTQDEPALGPGFHICVVGRLSDEKGQGTAIDAFAQFLDLRKSVEPERLHETYLHIAGDGPNRDRLEQQAHRLGLGQRIRFHGFLENPYPLIANSNVLLIPSRYEGLPNVALEAMALKTPVVSTKCSRSLETLISQSAPSNACGFLIQSGHVQAMAEQLLEVEHNEALRLRRSENALRYVHTHHTLESWLIRMQEIFRESSAEARK